METASHPNQTTYKPQANVRAADLRRWMYLNNITFVDLGRVCGITASAAQIALGKSRMPVRHYKAITEAYPELPVEFLPEQRDVPSGPRPKGLAPQGAA